MYYVLELQTNGDGTSGNFVFNYSDKGEAEAKFLAVRAAAAISNVMIHTAVWMDNRGNIIEKKAYIHPVAPEPEAEEQ